MSPFEENLETLIRARYPLIYLKSFEEQRVRDSVIKIVKRLEKRLFEWTAISGITVPSRPTSEPPKTLARTKQPLEALNQVADQVEPGVFVFYDFHHYLSSDNPLIIRKVKELGHQFKSGYRTLIFVAPRLDLPVDLEKEMTVLECPLPDRSALTQLLNDITHQLENESQVDLCLTSDDREQLVDASLGLTLSEAENVFAKIIVSTRQLSSAEIEMILEEKKQLVKKSGLLEFSSTQGDLSSVGGLSQLKAWLDKRSHAFHRKAAEFGLRPPRGVLLLGVQGCGKSLCAKAIAKAWHLPLLRFDIGRLFNSYIGSSEANMRRAIELAESISPAVLWIDEIDKAFAGVAASAGSDSGTTARVMGTFLTWLAEKQSAVFVVATANDISSLPPELLRKGRLDEIFFVDLPNEQEREEIIGIHLEQRGRNPADFSVPELAKEAKEFSGAEIEEAINSALYDAYHSGVQLNHHLISEAIRQTVPLAQTLDEKLKQLRSWARGRARRAGDP